jgi:hypothetical protein
VDCLYFLLDGKQIYISLPRLSIRLILNFLKYMGLKEQVSFLSAGCGCYSDVGRRWTGGRECTCIVTEVEYTLLLRVGIVLFRT